ncbi:hypothetical protein [Methylocapsa acidiphila]|uniref:hypothetical protein n=1 Tax=Methylocapsa acidiphila TaxID=133552 RepID=UPI00041FCDFC|nr:hypothetical protein [Methylocapsa acidiphila]
METENAFYAGVQIIHNFGAATVAAAPVAALWFRDARAEELRRLAFLTFFAWLIQAASGVGFGTISFFMEGELPEIHHQARIALIVKILCAASALILLSIHFIRRTGAPPGPASWRALAGFGFTALAAAAVLRWFS